MASLRRVLPTDKLAISSFGSFLLLGNALWWHLVQRQFADSLRLQPFSGRDVPL